jgi:hypothetical protein
MNLVDEDIWITSQLLQLNIGDAARTDGVALIEDGRYKADRLRMLAGWADEISRACNREATLWESLESWLAQQNGSLKG